MAGVEPEEEPEVRPLYKYKGSNKIPPSTGYLSNDGGESPPPSPRWMVRIEEWQRRLPVGIAVRALSVTTKSGKEVKGVSVSLSS